MRQQFLQQLSLGVVPIGEVSINLKSRHELPPVLFALQYAFNDKEVSEEIFAILDRHILSGKKKTGRTGMSLWEILVLGSTKLCLNADFDRLHDLANNHNELRGILGVQKSDFSIGKQYHLQTLKDNVQLLDEETIKQINLVIVKGAHGLIKKNEGVEYLELQTKADSFVVESHVHFPTDINLLWDSCRKCLDVIVLLRKEGVSLTGWGQVGRWFGKVRKVYRACSEVHRKKGGNYQQRLSEATKGYLKLSKELAKKVEPSLLDGALYMASGVADLRVYNLLKELAYYLSMLNKHRDLLRRRVLQGEKIPHEEKIFSLFEPHVEWNSKGKTNKSVEIGHNTLIVTDQYQFILYHEVYEKQVDKQRTIAIGKAVAKDFSGQAYRLLSISFDRGFYSLLAKKALSKLFTEVILPKPGKKSRKQQTEESAESFVAKRKAHSAVEANISQLEHFGLDICRDKGIKGFKRYVAYGVLSYNLHKMGRLLMAMEGKKQKKAA